jgi:hypothetical protein
MPGYRSHDKRLDVFEWPTIRCESCGTRQAVDPDSPSPKCRFCGEALPVALKPKEPAKEDRGLLFGVVGVVAAAMGDLMASTQTYEDLHVTNRGVGVFVALLGFVCGIVALVMNRGHRRLGSYLGVLAILLACAWPIIVLTRWDELNW